MTRIVLPAALGRLWLNSLRIRLLKSTIPESNAIIALWHEHLPICIRVFRQRGFNVLISRSWDGELAACICRAWGYHVFRGSSSAGGTAGMKQMARRLIQAESKGLAGMALDGPRGPYHRIQPGTAWLSQITEIPVFPVTVDATAAVRLNNWDRTLIPLPFSTVRVGIGKPIFPRQSEDLRIEMNRKTSKTAKI
jgi:lysophospholipid acyltransferase (LPLAT)-like uncharacterized protein